MRLVFVIFIFILQSCGHHNVINFRMPSSFKEREIAVLGDLEGNLNRFEDFIKKTDTLYRAEDGKLKMIGDKKFVFLGDVMDRGPGSLRIMNDLIHLKKKYPNQVTIILGNRDINKLKIMSLMDKFLNKPVPEIVLPWYKEIFEKDYGFKIPKHLSTKGVQKFVQRYDTPLLRFKAFLAGMNAPKAFEYRKEELKILVPTRTIDDNFVFASFLNDYEEGGILREYLKQGQLAKVIDGNLFVHGAVTDNNIGYVPGNFFHFKDTREWISKLNQWAKSEINDWFNDSSKAKDLLVYHAPKQGTIQNEQSVIYGRYSDEEGNPHSPRRKLIKKLQSAGIHRIIVGHTPTGDFPIILRKPNFEVVLADSSFSSTDNASKIIIQGEDVYIETETKDGGNLIVNSNVNDTMNPIGMKTRDGHRIIGRYENSDDLLALRVEGKGRKFKTQYLKESALDLAERGLVEAFEQRLKDPCTKIMKIFLKKDSI